jgi:hypothetical protein
MMHPPRRAIPTRAGLFALGAPIVLGVAAVNASNNLLFMLLGGVLGAIVLSGLLSERNIRGVSARVHPVSAVHAEEPARLQVTLRRERDPKTGRFDPAYALMLKERRSSTFLGDLLSRERRRDLLDVTVPILAEGTESRLATRVFASRGPGTIGRCELVTRYPFGLLIKSKDVDVDLEVLVRPKRIPVPSSLADPRNVAADGDASGKRGIGMELYGLREKEERDSFHRVHALRSLSLGFDVVLETDGVERPMAWLGVANDPTVDPIGFERALEIAQAVLVEWDRRGFAVGLVTNDAEYRPNLASLEVMLDALARLEPRVLDRAANRSVEPPIWIVPAGAERSSAASVIAKVDAEGSLAVVGRGAPRAAS